MCYSLAFNLCRPVGVMRLLLLLLCSVVVVIVVFFFYYSYCSFSNSALFHFFSSPSFVFFSFFSSFLTNIGHPLWSWPITPVHAHYKLFPSKARTNERMSDRMNEKSPIEEYELQCNTSFTMAISNIRHVSCCFVFWLKKIQEVKKTSPKFVYQSICPSGRACKWFAMCEFICTHTVPAK